MKLVKENINDYLYGPSEEEIENRLEKTSISPNELLEKSAEHGYLKGVQKAIEQGANIQANRYYALRAASRNGHLDVIKYLDELKPLEREIIILRVWEGLSYKEIATIIGKNEASLKMLFSRTIHKINQEITLAILLYFFINI